MEPVHTKRSTHALALLAFLLVAIVLTISVVRQRQEIRERAQAGATLTVVPGTSEVASGNEITFAVVLNSDTDLISAADVIVDYDPTYLEPVSISQGSFLPVLLSPGVFAGNQGRITLGSEPASPKTGQGTLVSFTFKALLPVDTTTVSLNGATAVAAIGSTENVVTSLTPGTVKITPAGPPVPADTILSFSQPIFSVGNPEEFTVMVKISTGQNIVTAADLVINYDTIYLDGVSISNAGFLPVTLTQGAIGSGVATIVVGSAADTPKQGEGNLASLTFRGKLTGSSTIVINQSSKVAALGTNTNVVKQWLPLLINIGGASLCTSLPPNVPTNFTATSISSDKVSLSWASQANVTYYDVVYGTGSGSYNYGAYVGNVTAFTVTGLSPGTRYYFAVFAVNNCAASGFSTEAVAQTLSASSSPLTTSSVAPSPSYYYPSPTPAASFVPITPHQTSAEVIPFLVQKPAVNEPAALPDLAVPAGFSPDNTYVQTPNSSLWVGLILITAGVLGGFMFYRWQKKHSRKLRA